MEAATKITNNSNITTLEQIAIVPTKGESWLIYYTCVLRKNIEGYLDSVPSLTSNATKTLLIMHAFHNSNDLQSKWMLNNSHASMV